MKKCIIMSGISGSGKSTWIENQGWWTNSVVYSADFFFTKNDVYQFDASKLGDAHAWCMRNFVEGCQKGTQYEGKSFEEPFSLLVVDNINLTSEEIAPYYSVAKAYGYEVELITLRVDPRLAAKRNQHGVNLKTLWQMNDRLAERKLPRFWDLKCHLLDQSQ